MGSANYTTGGLSTQANLMHTFDSPALASIYLERFTLLKDNPRLAELAPLSGWSRPITIGDAGVRAFFSPEPKDSRVSIDTIVEAIHRAKSSVLFCLFTPTDEELRDACFMAADNGKMMFGLVNRISRPKVASDSGDLRADQLAALELYHRSRNERDVIGTDRFSNRWTPDGFDSELIVFPGEKPPPFPPVVIHHKFVVIDAETDQPLIYTGSANMSKNSLYKNDENLLEIRGSTRLAAVYLAEFLRLYEHYRARAVLFSESGSRPANRKISLKTNSQWAEKYYKPGTPEYKSRPPRLESDLLAWRR
jgi:phosphatidylserine/phosphatidylglycerophosphate/cardiolipin synthase-like enzyme